ncbi:hypothetical protein [Paludisphaera borealis]|nr:hypothetical protein [Paludisphaera borealis]
MPPAIWQQQMQLMESFHNDMILMVQMFVAMHQEHQATMRVELDRVEQLTRELSGLQEKLARALPQEEDATSKSTSRPPRRERPAAGGGSSDAVPKSKGLRPATPESRGSSTSAGPESRTIGATDAPDTPQGTLQGRRGPERSSDPEEAHGVLTERIATLQRERQGYWRQIINQISKRG